MALALAIMLALFLSLAESVRTQCARLYLKQMADSGIDSMFAQYHRKLWSDYRLLGLEHYSELQLTDEAESFMKPYLAADNWYPMSFENIQVTGEHALTDDEAEYFEEEILDYMKYGIAVSVMDEAEALQFTKDVEEGGSVDAVSELYEEEAKAAAKLEKAIDAISSRLSEAKENAEKAGRALNDYNCSDAVDALEDLEKDMKKIPGLVSAYVKKADAMSEALESARSSFENEKASGNLSDETYEALNADISEYEAYISKDGERRREIEGFTARAEADVTEIETIIDMAKEAQDEIDSYESSDDDDDGIDIEAVWEPVIERFDGLDIISMNEAGGIKDEEKEAALEGVKNLLQLDILSLVLPDGEEISAEELDMTDAPSLLEDSDTNAAVGNYGDAGNSGLSGSYGSTGSSGASSSAVSSSSGSSSGGSLLREAADRLFITEYVIQMMNYYGRGKYEAGSKKKGTGGLEAEYVIYGKSSDRENLKALMTEFTAIRSGLNLVFLLKDTEKRNEAKALAMAITGAAAFTPLSGVVQFMILSMWSLGQAVCDARDILRGKRVPFMHTRSSFYLSVEGLLNLGREQTAEAIASAAGDALSGGSGGDNAADSAGSAASNGGTAASEDTGSGLQYKDYLRLFLLLHLSKAAEYRCMDMIQLSIRAKQKDFKLSQCLHDMELWVKVRTGHIFSELGIVKSFGGLISDRYTMETTAFYSY